MWVARPKRYHSVSVGSLCTGAAFDTQVKYEF